MSYHLTIYNSEVRLIPGDKMPVKPDKYSYNPKAFERVANEYESSLQTAIKESVLCADQEKGLRLINSLPEAKVLSCCPGDHTLHSTCCLNGHVYGPFEGEYKTEWRQYCQQMNGSGCRERCKPIPASHGAMDCKFKDKPHEVVAILSEPLRDEQVKEEHKEIHTRDSLMNEWGNDDDGTDPFDWLIKNFVLTRKQ